MKKADKDIDDEGVRSPLKGSGGYGIWDITGYYRPTKGLTARAGAFNILDKKYITWGEAKGLADDISQHARAMGRRLIAIRLLSSRRKKPAINAGFFIYDFIYPDVAWHGAITLLTLCLSLPEK